MTTVTRTPVAFLSAVSGAAGSTKGSPGATSGWVDVNAYAGGDMLLSILNGASAPGAAGSLTIQASTDNGTTVADYYTLTGDTNAYSASTQAGLTTQTIKIDDGIRYLRVIGWGNTTNAVTYNATFSGVTRS